VKFSPVAYRPTDAVVWFPSHECGINASLHDEILNEAADVVVDEARHDPVDELAHR